MSTTEKNKEMQEIETQAKRLGFFLEPCIPIIPVRMIGTRLYLKVYLVIDENNRELAGQVWPADLWEREAEFFKAPKLVFDLGKQWLAESEKARIRKVDFVKQKGGAV